MNVISVVIMCLAASHFSSVNGGICWLSRSRNGRCRQMYSVNISRDQCCSLTIPAVAISWTPRDVASHTHTMLFTGGATQCHVCHKTCDKVKCGADRKCRVRHGQARCVCSPQCPRHLKMMGVLCGSDQKTYKHYCAMLRHNCKHNREVKPAYLGHCKDSCRGVKCFRRGHHCLQDQHGLPHCVPCNTYCSNVPFYSLCGEDGVTYSSQCHLVAAICMKGAAIRVAYTGPCIGGLTCETLKCPDDRRCLMNYTSGLPQCVNCKDACSILSGAEENIFVCGSDGHTYSSYCQMQRHACRTGVVIKTAHYGRCKDT
ncbi:follistatin-like [Haliotis cracherodii]|uniref:follistatin-like n=1 Tax=Haliotis cracherodii TaxID=6455 RepID=UPI0039EBBC39